MLERHMSTKWLKELQEKVANCWEWHSPALQITFRYAKPDQGDDFWEIWAYPAVQEIVGGKEDGETVWSGLQLRCSGILDRLRARSRRHQHSSVCPSVRIDL